MKQAPIRVSLLLALFAANAHAQLFSDGEARKSAAEAHARIGTLNQTQRALDERLGQVEQQLRSGGLVDLANQLEIARGDMAKLRGQIEVLNYELGESQKRQRDLYVDLDSRMRKIESAQAAAAAAPPPSPPPTTMAPAPPEATAQGNVPGTTSPPPGPLASLPPTTPPTTAPNSADAAREQRAYDAALDLFKRGDYSGSITAFGAYLRSYPRTALSPSAQYWIGNAHFARRDFKSAITAQRTLIANYPDSNKVPDALLNIASAQSELGDTAGARRTLEELVTRHPTSEAAGKAKQRLAGR